jgi:PKD repeat protein
MRSFHRHLCFMAALSLLGAACGGDDDGGPSNTPPTATFAAPTCDPPTLTCTFTDASTDADGTVESREWAFENGTPAASSEVTQVVEFSSVGPHTVTLTVTDNEGATNSTSQEVTIGTTPGNQPPTAAFTVECSSLECTFTDGSSDADGTIASYAWDFGDPLSADNTSEEASPTHIYSFSELTEVTVTLTVTDDDGDASEPATETFTVSPPAGLTCDGTDCSLTLTADASVTVTLTSAECEASGNTFMILTPVEETLFTDGCNAPEPGSAEATFQLDGGTVFTAGTQITAQVISGLPDQDNPPTVRVLGVYPTWTLEFDDGRGCPPENPACGEPDFNDLKITVQANEVP